MEYDDLRFIKIDQENFLVVANFVQKAPLLTDADTTRYRTYLVAWELLVCRNGRPYSRENVCLIKNKSWLK